MGPSLKYEEKIMYQQTAMTYILICLLPIEQKTAILSGEWEVCYRHSWDPDTLISIPYTGTVPTLPLLL